MNKFFRFYFVVVSKNFKSNLLILRQLSYIKSIDRETLIDIIELIKVRAYIFSAMK